MDEQSKKTTKEAITTQSTTSIEPELDLESEKFDPIAALTSDIDAIRIPEPRAKVFNHLDEYENKSFAKQLGLLVKTSASEEAGKVKEKSKSSGSCPSGVGGGDKLKFDRLEREAELRKTLVPSVRKHKDQSVLTKMNENVAGPLAFLFKCIGQQIKVFIRRRKLIFQNCEQFANLYGCLVAFDKHFNLILKDVIEKVNLTSTCTNGETVKKRNLKTIFIRGTNIILISFESTCGLTPIKTGETVNTTGTQLRTQDQTQPKI